MSFDNNLNKVLEEIKKTEDYNSEKYNVEYAIVAFLTDKDCPGDMMARNIIVRLSDRDITDRIKSILDSCYG